MTRTQPIATLHGATASSPATHDISRAARRTAYILTGLSGAFLLFDAAMKFVQPQPVLQATMQLGYPASTITGIGAALLISTVLYLIPRTAVLGALLLTAYLGGAVASGVRAERAAFDILFPAIFASIVWGGLWLRDTRVRDLLPLKNTARSDQRSAVS